MKTQKWTLLILALFLLPYYIVPCPSYGQRKSKIYWTETGRIKRANLDGSEIEDVLTETFSTRDLALDLRNRKIYWTEGPTAAKIRRATLDGFNVENIVTGFELPPDVERVTVSCRNRKCEGTALLKDGGSIKIPHELLLNPYCLAIDTNADKIYWANWYLRSILRGNLDGSDRKELPIREQNLPLMRTIGALNIELDLKAGKMYWTDAWYSRITRANLDGSDPEDLIAGLRSVYGFALDLHARKMYWSNTSTGKIQRADLDGNNIEDLVTGLKFSPDIFLDLQAHKIYWVNRDLSTGIGKIQRANFDGSNVTDILTGLNEPFAIALDPGETYDVAPDAEKLTTTWANVKFQ